MVEEGIIHQFDEIEGKVERLIEACKALERSNSELKSRIQELETGLKVKTEAENIYQEQKTLIKQKIDGLLQRLNSYSNGGAL